MRDAVIRTASCSFASVVLGFALLIAFLLPVAAETKPPSAFGAPAPVESAPPPAFAPPQAAPLAARGPFGRLMAWVTDTQQKMQRELAGSVKRLKSGNAIAAALTLAGLSFLYGVVHAVGPGHGRRSFRLMSSPTRKRLGAG
jgi:hypothetical protein